MCRNKLVDDSPILKLTHLKIWRQDGVKSTLNSLTALEEDKLKMAIDGYINGMNTLEVEYFWYLTLSWNV